MSNNLLYLKEDVYFEPLINHWYAWPYLLPPVQASRYITKTHRRIMKSFIQNTQLHILATKESRLTGGEFLNVREDQTDEIKALLIDIDENKLDIIDLSNSVNDLEEILRNHTNGESIESIYELIPEPLKGYIEIYFDLNHNVSYRLLEKLLYESKYYQTSLQSVSFGLISKVQERPFSFSTPRLADENHIQLNMDFNSPELTNIFRSRTEGISETEIIQIFDKAECFGGLNYQELFTDTPPKSRFTPVENGTKMSFLGHASFLLQTKSVSILIDPVIAITADSSKNETYSYCDLPPKLDYICVTHSHQDHFNLESLLQLRHKTDKLIVPRNNGGSLQDPSMKLIAEQLGFNVIEVDDFDEISIPEGKLMSLPFLGEHGDLNVRSKTVWFIELQNKKYFFGADATNCDPSMYKHVQKYIGDIDVLAIGMECVGAPYTWLYGALSTTVISKNIKESRRLNGANASQACHMVDTFNAKQVYIYAMGMEPWYKYFMGVDYDDEAKQIAESNKMIKYCEDKNIPCERLVGKYSIDS